MNFKCTKYLYFETCVYLNFRANVTVCAGYPKPTREEIIHNVKGMHGILWTTSDRLNAEILDAAGPQLKSISTMTAGLDYVDVSELKRRGIKLGYTPNIVGEAVADLAIGLMIAAGRRFHEGRLHIEQNKWEERPQYLLGHEIKSSTIGIVGFGAIGQAVAKRLQGFSVSKILYSGHREKPEGAELGASFVPFNDVLENSDYILVSAPLTDETRGMFNEQAFNKMKRSSIFVNVARGGLVDQDALYYALKEGKIFAAGLDVMTPEPLPIDDPLLKLPNCGKIKLNLILTIILF